jgi:hypothetical protein
LTRIHSRSTKLHYDPHIDPNIFLVSSSRDIVY